MKFIEDGGYCHTIERDFGDELTEAVREYDQLFKKLAAAVIEADALMDTANIGSSDRFKEAVQIAQNI